MSRPPRLDALEYVGTRPFFLTICTEKRERHFTDAAVVDMVLLHFLRTAEDQAIEITAYCFMPDHMHALISGCDSTSDLRRYVSLAKQHSAYSFARDRHCRLWQEGYFDRALRNDEAIADVTAYIIENPIRASLVARATDYPFWGSSKWSRDELLEFLLISRP